jgi:hypothetical protein
LQLQLYPFLLIPVVAARFALVANQLVQAVPTNENMRKFEEFLPHEQARIDYLLGLALQNKAIQSRLLSHDQRLQEEYEIPSSIWQCVSKIHAQSLEDFCRELHGLVCRKD